MPSPSESALVFFQGLGVVLALELLAAVLDHALLRATVGRPGLRAGLRLTLLALHHAALFLATTGPDLLVLGVVFVWLHLGFTFRFLSGVYRHRDAGPAPTLLFHVLLLVWGPRLHYGASRWEDLRGRRLDRALIREYAAHLAYGLLVLAGVGALLVHAWSHPVPARPYVIRSAAFVLALQLLTLLVDLGTLPWAARGCHRGFFGRFAWIRSNHIGEFWRSWNRFAGPACRELSGWAGLGRSGVVATLAPFLASGLPLQVCFGYFTRAPSYGVVLSLALHALAVHLFERLHRARGRMPRVAVRALFNPVTSALVTLAVSQPLVLDLYGRFRFPFP